MSKLEASWQIAGVVTEKRMLTSTKNAAWRGYVGKLCGIGTVFEINLTEEQFAAVNEGDEVEWRGKFDQQQGKLRFTLIGPVGAVANPGLPPVRPRSTV